VKSKAFGDNGGTIKARTIAAECFFPHQLTLRGADLDGVGTVSFDGTLHKTLGERIGALPWTERYREKKSPSGIAPDRLEAHGADCSSTGAHRLYAIV
jgi:hypothetical protein